MKDAAQQIGARVTTPTEREILIERGFDAPREKVWRAFTEPDLLARWWGRGHRPVIERFAAERDGMLQSGMESGMNESCAALDRVLAGMR